MTFRLIEAEKAQHPVSLLCSVLGVTRAGYYAWRERGPSRRALGDAELASLIGRVFVESLETYGAPRACTLNFARRMASESAASVSPG
jgi:putative transposase